MREWGIRIARGEININIERNPLHLYKINNTFQVIHIKVPKHLKNSIFKNKVF